jgi:hypothetical protein
LQACFVKRVDDDALGRHGFADGAIREDHGATTLVRRGFHGERTLVRFETTLVQRHRRV